MPRPHVQQNQCIRGLCTPLGPEEFYRRLEWLDANRKWTSYRRLEVDLAKAGIRVFPHLGGQIRFSVLSRGEAKRRRLRSVERACPSDDPRARSVRL
jgi:hypothetical protein